MMILRGLLRAERPNPSLRASRRRAHKFNKTTETQGLQRKAMPFYEKKEVRIQSERGK